jgi:hypothetical protein
MLRSPCRGGDAVYEQTCIHAGSQTTMDEALSSQDPIQGKASALHKARRSSSEPLGGVACTIRTVDSVAGVDEPDD